MKVFTDSMKEMSPEELKEVCDDLDLSPMRYTPEAVTIALRAAIRLGGFLPYQIAVIVANAVAKALIGRGLSLGANAALTRLMGTFAGPIGWILSAGWLLADIAGAAYRITIPAVIMVAYLRRHKARPETTKSGNNRWWFWVIVACGWAATTTTALFGGNNRWWLWVIAAAAAGIVLMAALA